MPPSKNRICSLCPSFTNQIYRWSDVMFDVGTRPHHSSVAADARRWVVVQYGAVHGCCVAMRDIIGGCWRGVLSKEPAHAYSVTIMRNQSSTSGRFQPNKHTVPMWIQYDPITEQMHPKTTQTWAARVVELAETVSPAGPHGT